ncbi:cytochrome P450 [Turneriella parva]|uniref:Cytochrome P450 n=1 Tax=Turneriella parva (strain ATCC BAA-1111 / DSM 21527 / NCTC 11395 / H) TaxID=869212 RepID=I4BB48_TURPD|nr:cytochrome P450 [Turneriella parva]AFM14505.1 cytochrome P450 [Turneriella parva DSM 21527]
MADTAIAAGKIPPGPKITPLDLAAELLKGDPQIVRDPYAYFSGLHEKYGDLVYSDFGVGSFYITDNLALIRKIFVSEPRNYAKADAYLEAAHFLGNGILNSEGDFWQAQRAMVQPAFTKSRLNAFMATMLETGRHAAQHLQGQADVSGLAMHIALENICRFLFGSDFAANEKTIRAAVEFGNNFISRRIQMPFKLPIYFPSLSNLRFFWHRFELDQILYRIIDERLASPQRENRDLLGMLLAAEKESQGGKVRKEQVRDEIITLLIAGHETTGFTLAMALWLLAADAGLQQRLRDEADAATAGGQVDFEKCPLSEAVVNETLRLYPAAWIIGRRLKADEVFEGYLLKKGAQLQTGIIALHRNPRYWSEPDRFKPERFLGENAEPSVKQAFMPFGAGPRKCIGSVFAMLEMQTAIYTLLQKYRLSRVAGYEPKIEYLFTARLKEALPVVFEPIA